MLGQSTWYVVPLVAPVVLSYHLHPLLYTKVLIFDLYFFGEALKENLEH